MAARSCSRVACGQTETSQETLAPFAQGGSPLGQRRLVAGDQQYHGHVVAGELALDHFLQADQGLANIVFGGCAEQVGGIDQPWLDLEAGPGATAPQQQAVQFGRRNGVAAAVEQGGEGVIGGILNRHGQLGARRRND